MVVNIKLSLKNKHEIALTFLNRFLHLARQHRTTAWNRLWGAAMEDLNYLTAPFSKEQQILRRKESLLKQLKNLEASLASTQQRYRKKKQKDKKRKAIATQQSIDRQDNKRKQSPVRSKPPYDKSSLPGGLGHLPIIRLESMEIDTGRDKQAPRPTVFGADPEVQHVGVRNAGYPQTPPSSPPSISNLSGKEASRLWQQGRINASGMVVSPPPIPRSAIPGKSSIAPEHQHISKGSNNNNNPPPPAAPTIKPPTHKAKHPPTQQSTLPDKIGKLEQDITELEVERKDIEAKLERLGRITQPTLEQASQIDTLRVRHNTIQVRVRNLQQQHRIAISNLKQHK